MPVKAEPTNARGVRPYRFPGDPLIGDHEGCIRCGGVRSRVAVKHGDPFCTTTCCRSYFAVQVDSPPPAPLNA